MIIMLNRNFLIGSKNIYKKPTNIFSKCLAKEVTFSLLRITNLLLLKLIRLLPYLLHIMPHFPMFLLNINLQSFQHLKLFRKRHLIQSLIIPDFHNINKHPKSKRFIIRMLLINQSKQTQIPYEIHALPISDLRHVV